MKKINSIKNRSFLRTAAFFLTMFWAISVFGADPWRAFYDALLERGYYDTAIDYLELYRGKPNCPPDLADQIDYLVGKTTLGFLRTATSAERTMYINRGREILTKFLDEHPEHPSAFEASAALASICMDEGTSELAKTTDDMSDLEKLKYRNTARQSFSDAKAYLDRAVDMAKIRVKEIRSDPERKNSPEADRIYGEYLDLLLDSTRLTAREAETNPENSPNWTTGLEAAKTKFNEIYEKYQLYPGGYRARFEEAKIADKLGRTDAAIEMLDEISALPPQRPLFSLQTEALLLSGQIALRDKKPVRLMGLIQQFNQWKNVQKYPPVYYDSTEGLQIHLCAGQAALELFRLRQTDRKAFNAAGKEAFTDRSDPAVKLMSILDNFAYEQFDFVYQQRSSLSLEAEKFLQDPAFAERQQKTNSEKPLNFEAAAKLVNRLWTDFVQANLEAADAYGDEAVLAAEERKKTSADSAERGFRWAFEMAGRGADGKTLDDLRLQWATLKLLLSRFEEAQILADYLLYRRPAYPSVTKAAEVSLHAARNLYQQAKKDGVDAETLAMLEQQVQDKTDYIIKRWGEGLSGVLLPIVQEAVLVRMQTAIASGNIAAAKDFLGKIPDDSPQKSEAWIQLGQSLWAEYVKRLNESNGAESDAQNSAELLASARESLEKGLLGKIEANNGVRSDDLTAVYAALSLAQIAVTDHRPDDTVQWLTHPTVGPLTLVEKHLAADSAASGENASGDAAPLGEQFRLTALTLSLRAFVAVKDFARAEQVMCELEKFVGTDKKNEQRLTGVYLQLGKQLEDQIRQLRAAAAADPVKTAELASVSEGFENFLDRISKRSEGNTYFTLRWVADTFYSLGVGMTDEGTAVSEADAAKSKEYFEKSGRTYHAILKKFDADPASLPNENARTVTSMKLADCLRRVGRCSQAIHFILPSLQTNENNLELQFAAADIYRYWGEIDPTYYVRAIQGGEPKENAKNLIWGWNRIITLLSRNMSKSDLYRQRFYEAVLRKMECRAGWLKSLASAEDRKKQAQSAENELLRLYQVHPDLGGPAFFHKLDDFLKEFRRELGTAEPSGFRPAAEPES